MLFPFDTSIPTANIWNPPVTDSQWITHPFLTADSICLLTREALRFPTCVNRTLSMGGWLTNFPASAKLLEQMVRPLSSHYNSLGNEMSLACGWLPRTWGKYIVTGNKERIVSVTDDTAAHIERYLREFHNGERSLNKPLFYTTIKGSSSRMSESNVERIVRKYADIVRKDHPKLPNPVYPHMFRTTRATGLYQDGVSLDMISRTLGHNSTKTIRIYAAPSMEMLHEAMDTNIIGKVPKEKLWRGNNEEIARMCGLR